MNAVDNIDAILPTLDGSNVTSSRRVDVTMNVFQRASIAIRAFGAGVAHKDTSLTVGILCHDLNMGFGEWWAQYSISGGILVKYGSPDMSEVDVYVCVGQVDAVTGADISHSAYGQDAY